MKITWIFLGLVLAGARAASPADAVKDKVTGLAVYPGLNNPSPLPATVLCKSQSSGDFFIVSGKSTKEVVGWYTTALPGFKKFSAVMDGTSQDTFFSADGTQQITLTGVRNSPDAYLISYRRYSPGLSAAAMASFNTGKLTCGGT
jgi:hypothetical protein